MYPPNDDLQASLAHRRAVRGKSERAYGGPTTPWRVTQAAKVVLQKYGVADICSFKRKHNQAVMIVILKPQQFDARLTTGKRFDNFLTELTQATEACGYIVSYDDSAIHLESVDAFC